MDHCGRPDDEPRSPGHWWARRRAPRPDGLQVVRLECAARATDALENDPVVHCRWSEPQVPPAAAVRLWRLVDPGSGNAREVVYRSDDLAVQEFTDAAVRPRPHLQVCRAAARRTRSHRRSQPRRNGSHPGDATGPGGDRARMRARGWRRVRAVVAGRRRPPRRQRRSRCGARSTDRAASSWRRSPPTVRPPTVIRCLPARAASSTPSSSPMPTVGSWDAADPRWWQSRRTDPLRMYDRPTPQTRRTRDRSSRNPSTHDRWRLARSTRATGHDSDDWCRGAKPRGAWWALKRLVAGEGGADRSATVWAESLDDDALGRASRPPIPMPSACCSAGT